MIKAIIFDFDGVIVDSEPVHLKAFQTVLLEKGIILTDELYYNKYLAYDDKRFFTESLTDFGKYKDENQVSELIKIKSGVFDKLIENNIRIFPGVLKFLKSLNYNYRVAIGSGALRNEIESILKHSGMTEYFEFIVSADEVINCKPDPEVYLTVLKKFNNDSVNLIEANECIVFEDAQHGVDAAKTAGMKCIAVKNSNEDIKNADYVINSFLNTDIEKLINQINY